MSKKISIHVSDTDLDEILQLGEILGYDESIYGWFPKILKFSITFTKKSIQQLEKVIPDLDDTEMNIFFSSIERLRKKKKLLLEAEKIKLEAEKV